MCAPPASRERESVCLYVYVLLRNVFVEGGRRCVHRTACGKLDVCVCVCVFLFVEGGADMCTACEWCVCVCLYV